MIRHLIILLAWMVAQPGMAIQPDGDLQHAPFTDLVSTDKGVVIEVEDSRWIWQALNGIPIERLIEGASALGSWETRLAEDLTAVLSHIGEEHGDVVTLQVRPLDGGDVVVLEDVAMTRENRRATRRARALRDQQTPLNGKAVLDEVVAVVNEHHAYAAMKGLDLNALVEAEAARLGDSPDRDACLLAAQRLVCRLGDGHASVAGWLGAAPAGRLDFLLQHAGEEVVAFRRPGDDGRLLVDGFPYVVSIDGRPIDEWIAAASVYVTDGSDALVRRRSTRLLRFVNLIRDELGLERRPAVTLELRNEDGNRATISVPVVDRRAAYGVWPRVNMTTQDRGFDTARLDSGIGYIRLVRMVGDDEAAALRTSVEGLLDCRGLIIDVRGNGGGSRAPIRALLPLFLEDGARVVNVATRLEPAAPRPPEGWLADRAAYPLGQPHWTPAERTAIDACIKDFEPAWAPGDRFSDWHVFVVSRAPSTYDGPVVILMDEACFSATDVFLAAFKGVENVTLIGSPSSGGSARGVNRRLTMLNTTVRLATMASFQPDGRLFDGHGVAPDVMHDVTVDDLLGRTDSMLDAAIRAIGDE